jgi:hypothetical protein
MGLIEADLGVKVSEYEWEMKRGGAIIESEIGDNFGRA